MAAVTEAWARLLAPPPPANESSKPAKRLGPSVSFKKITAKRVAKGVPI